MADFVSRRAKWTSEVWITTFMRSMIWFCGGRRYTVFGSQVLEDFTPESQVLIVSNHRSFFDMYVISYMTVTRSKLSRRAFFPVRSDFFYDRWLGGFVNAAMSGFMMFPPVFRDPKKSRFNLYGLRRVADELSVPGTYVGIHPEGTRGKGDDPYEFLPAQPGVGRIALEAKDARVVPVFLVGMSNNLLREAYRNWFEPSRYPIDIVFGKDVELDDLRAKGTRVTIAKKASDRLMKRIGELGQMQKKLRARLGPECPATGYRSDQQPAW